MLGTWIRETFHASSGENVRDPAGEVNREKILVFSWVALDSLVCDGHQLQQCVCVW